MPYSRIVAAMAVKTKLCDEAEAYLDIWGGGGVDTFFPNKIRFSQLTY